MTLSSNQRRYDIDWLRNLAFLILIFYHIGMYYVFDWGWHIKSAETFRWLQEVMILTNTWRMSLLFFISAMALSLIEKRYSIWSLMGLRTNRLFVPLIFGMFVIVAPQVYIEARAQYLIPEGFWSFWVEYINPNTDLLKEHQSIIGLLTWNHLWFLPYLWIYSLIVLAIRPLLANVIGSRFFQNIPFVVAFICIVAGLLLVYLTLRLAYPTTHDLTNDWYNHAKSFLIFVFGYTFAQQMRWWNTVIAKRRWFLYLAILGYLFIVADRNGDFTWLAEQYEGSIAVRGLYGTIFIINLWAWIFSLVGYAGQYLNRPAKFVSYANKAVLPWYMFHQTLIVMLAWYLKPYNLPTFFDFLLILSGTVTGCLIGYEIVKRTAITRWLFGLKHS
ncbi:acyltransferase family protein [Aliiglaciecola sp. 2_MG-2023]|uniref:acyltransferase family protein n=1 Tax=unclassified Aliiglaciecola TaxID=2593648 RepID=UPI0026E36914|nr:MULTISPECIES: acyltransferase family protein [unclassified Aliiglaciecola]MDO6709464.1 acyltransferase family protein [Aliiglaciecola sp. 2_MG-2023]MDO6750612.1 acyltransferase family protein [Aliiglaciecola sp. 1_MG-2023]